MPSTKCTEVSGERGASVWQYSAGSHDFQVHTHRPLAASADPAWAMAMDVREVLRSGSALHRNREARAIKPSRSDGGSAATMASPAEAPRAHRKKTEPAVAVAVTATTA